MKNSIHIAVLLLFPLFLLNHCSYTRPLPHTTIHFRNDIKKRLVEHAKSFLGVPYRYGGTTQSGMDCSGLIVRVYKDIYGIDLPHNTSLLYKKGLRLSLRSLEIGDLVFYGEHFRAIPSHVGIYIGNNQFIHSTKSKGVIISDLRNGYFKMRFAGARRVVIK